MEVVASTNAGTVIVFSVPLLLTLTPLPSWSPSLATDRIRVLGWTEKKGAKVM